MSQDQYHRIKNVVKDQLGVPLDCITPEANLTDELGADSLDVIELVMGIEEEFDIHLSDEEMDSVATVNDLCEIVGRLDNDEAG